MINLTRFEIEKLIDFSVAAKAIEAAYRATSAGDVNLPPVGHIAFSNGADCHIKYGHMKGDPNFVIKVATGFSQNVVKGLPVGNGLVLVLSATTGQIEAMLHDEMILTDIRTGLGGAIASRILSRINSKHALILGTGQQARRQIQAHNALMPNLKFHIWGRDATKVKALIDDMGSRYEIRPTDDLRTAVEHSDVIVTATGSTSPILNSKWVQAGTHITAVGADAPGKQELDEDLVAKADVLAVDLKSQCLDHGEISHAAKQGLIKPNDIQEIGDLLDDIGNGRKDNSQITIADLTGIAAQDIAMANAILTAWNTQKK